MWFMQRKKITELKGVKVQSVLQLAPNHPNECALMYELPCFLRNVFAQTEPPNEFLLAIYPVTLLEAIVGVLLVTLTGSQI